MKKFAGVFIKGIGLGLGFGLCLAGAAALLFRAMHGDFFQAHAGYFTLYFLLAGFFVGLIGGWCLALQLVLNHLLSILFLQISQLVPITTSLIGEEWVSKMETFFNEVLRPLPSFFAKLVEMFFVRRFRDVGKINRAITKAKKHEHLHTYSPEWMARVALHYFLEPLWAFFYAAYAILFLLGCVFWSIPFFR